jgi:hypothetical protein
LIELIAGSLKNEEAVAELLQFLLKPLVDRKWIGRK